MLYHVKVISNAKVEKVEVLDSQNLKVKVSALAVDGKANEAVIKAISSYFKIKISEVIILKGEKSQYKIVEVNH